ncbi:MAG TPA: Holliday junction branch migration protein RuvA [Chitinophagales bacterium]|nr:Holliday junction branch migration protein RuvA [Chitinophagales bacterium]
MIAYIKGYLALLTPTYAIVESKEGLGYQLNISLNTYTEIQGSGDVKLFTYIHISGGAQSPIVASFYGFHTEAEREMFVHLLSVSGVGASSVRLILSALKPDDLVGAIASGDVGTFQRIKGVGPKTAQRIILDLKDKITKAQPSAAISSSVLSNNAGQEALSALVMLGFNRTQAQTVVQKLVRQSDGTPTVEGLIKDALKHL